MPALSAKPDKAEMRYRPRLCAETGSILAAEAEVMVSDPDQLASLGEGLADLTGDMIRQSLEALRDWMAAGTDIKGITLLLSAAQLGQPELADLILWEVDRQNMPPSCLGVALHDLPVSAEGDALAGWTQFNLARLASAGCRVELDEFGFGGLSPGAETGFDGDLIRIGRGLTQGCDHGLSQQRMILAVLALAERRGLSTLALDVATISEQSFLTQIGVDLLQGNVIGQPLSRDAFRKMLLEHRNPVPVRLPLRQAG